MTRADKAVIVACGACAVTVAAGLVLWLIHVIVIAVLVLGGALSVAGVAAGAGIQSGARRRIAQRTGTASAQREMDRARFAALTHLTDADERWLAERHFWVVPPEVVRLRAGQPWNQPWEWLFDVPAEVHARRRMLGLALRARDDFEGINRTREVVREEPVSGEIVTDWNHHGMERRLS